ncbi:hypothetical protein [Candidatus Nitronereus thalassa]|uniref:Ferric reductase like transmembrane component n=1 Tax=Candidatus Nitronereus thalassa TaxID=3020898 RepID=A0ABU3K2X1_9BACT|nr:hypothetical protein [Candidatus Nitronereus thalassa]MDT7040738.1 hypothetical protein [Candidatus Nitronereus thalassa]
MKEREAVTITGLVLFLALFWLGFLFHQSPRFAGSLWGGVFGVSGATLMLVPLAYLIIKRVKTFKQAVTRRVSMRTLLAWHIYAGVVGPILVLFHTGHKFESPLGIALTSMTVIVVLSGFTGRYLMGRISQEIKEKRTMLDGLNASYQETLQRLRTCCADKTAQLKPFDGFFSRLLGGAFFSVQEQETETMSIGLRAIRLSDAIADLEYAIKTHDTIKHMFTLWLRIHITLSMVLYTLLAFHIWAAIHFGLRWFS